MKYTTTTTTVITISRKALSIIASTTPTIANNSELTYFVIIVDKAFIHSGSFYRWTWLTTEVNVFDVHKSPFTICFETICSYLNFNPRLLGSINYLCSSSNKISYFYEAGFVTLIERKSKYLLKAFHLNSRFCFK